MTSTASSKKIVNPTHDYQTWAKKITPKRVHWLSLVLAALILAWNARNQWFYLDEWNFLVDRSIRPTGDDLNIFAGHNEHWSTTVVLGYRVLFKLFGVRTYAPYLVVLFAFHLALCHFLWRLLLRVGTQAWTAVAAIAIFAVLGAGWENLLWAFQWQLFGPLLFGVGALLLIRTTGRTQRNDVIAAGLLVLAVATSGTAITATAVVAIALLLRLKDGNLPGNVNLSPSDFLDARLWTQIALGDVPMVEGPPPLITSFETVELTPDGPECVIASPKSPAPKITLRFPQPSSLSLQNPLGGTLVVTAKNEKGRASRPLVIPAGPQQVLSVALPARALTITLPFSSPTRLCGVLPPPK